MASDLSARAVPRRPDWRRYRDRLDALAAADYNLDLDAEHPAADGWHLDHHDGALPPEPPGPPLPAGAPGASFAAARELVRDYAFPDPRLVTGIFSPGEPTPGRPMLLRARFLGLTFWFGVKVGSVTDGVRETDAGPVSVYGFDYATLAGHFERGQIAFEVRKTHATGAVAFHIDAFSRPDRIGNPFLRLGFRLFGRRLQLRFARTAVERVQRFVGQELAGRAGRVRAPGTPPAPADGPGDPIAVPVSDPPPDPQSLTPTTP